MIFINLYRKRQLNAKQQKIRLMKVFHNFIVASSATIRLRLTDCLVHPYKKLATFLSRFKHTQTFFYLEMKKGAQQKA